MSELLTVNYAPYHQSAVKPRGFAEFCEMVETHGQLTGIWELAQVDARTGQVIKRLWNKNVVTDQGAINILERAINSSAATPPAIANNILITNNSASTTTTASLAAGAATTISVATLPSALPNGTVLTVNYGGSNPTTCTVNNTGGYAQGFAGAITVSGLTVPVGGYATNVAVVPNPTAGDNPANSAALTANATAGLTSFSGNLATGAFTYSAGAGGAGNRSVVVTFQFTNAGSTAVGNYTDAWLVNVNAAGSIAAGVYFAHEINTPMRCDASNNVNATVTIKI